MQQFQAATRTVQFKYTLILAMSLLAISCASDPKKQTAEGKVSKKQVQDVPAKIRDDHQAPRKRLMVLPFLDMNATRPQAMRDQARAEFIQDLNQSGRVIVVDSRDLKLDPSKVMLSGDYVLKDIAKAAAELGATIVLDGKIMDIKVSRKADPVGIFRQMKTKFEASVRVRMVIAKSGKEIFNTVKTVTLEEAQTRVGENASADRMLQTNPDLVQRLMTDAFLDFQNQIFATLDKLAWEGRIALINGERIFLNVGRISGLQVGDILKVTEDGDEIFDPQTGNFIGKSQGRLKGTLEVISYFGQDGAVSLVHSGAGFKENDRVELY